MYFNTSITKSKLQSIIKCVYVISSSKKTNFLSFKIFSGSQTRFNYLQKNFLMLSKCAIPPKSGKDYIRITFNAKIFYMKTGFMISFKSFVRKCHITPRFVHLTISYRVSTIFLKYKQSILSPAIHNSIQPYT